MSAAGHERDLDRRVEEARARLRQLGYLKNPLESFVAGHATRQGLVRALLGVSMRLGLVGGLLAAGLVWLAIIAMNPGLLGAFRDLMLLALYLVVAYGLAVGVVACGVGGTLLLTARNLGSRARLAGMLFPIGTLATLLMFLHGTFWWHWNQFSPQARPFASGANVLAGLLIVLVALLFGRLARLGATLLIEAARGLGVRDPKHNTREAVRLLAAGLVACVLFFAYFSVTNPHRGSAGEAAAPFEVARPVPPLLIVGIDGISWNDLGYLIRQGDLPTIEAILEQSTRAPLTGAQGVDPPVLWTTIATGESSTRHGVNSFVISRLAGMQAGLSVPEPPLGILAGLGSLLPEIGLSREVPVSGMTRRSKAIWEIVGEKGVPTAVVNWWATWPADSLAGAVVSERAFARLSSPQRGPRDLAEVLAPTRLGAAAESLAAHATREAHATGQGLPPSQVVVARLAQAGDAFTLSMGERLVRELGGEGVAALYLPGLDILRKPLRLRGTKREGLAGLDARIRSIREHARTLDRGVRAVLGARRTAVALVVTPGTQAPGSPADEPGTFALCGPGVAAKTTASEIRAEEIAPTLLHYLGFPSSRKMAGQPRVDFLDAEAEPGPPFVVESFGERGARGLDESPYDEEFLDRLRSLGYIQ